MPLYVEERLAEAKSRLVGIRLTMLTLRLMENWRGHVRDYESAMILLAIAAINAEKFTRTGLEAEFEDLRRPIPPDRLTVCNISCIAVATGLNRETTRRRVNKLVETGVIVRREDGSVAFSDGLPQEPRMLELVRTQLETLTRTANDLIRDGSLTLRKLSAGDE